jgi:hypothetical protein
MQTTFVPPETTLSPECGSFREARHEGGGDVQKIFSRLFLVTALAPVGGIFTYADSRSELLR